MLNGVETGTRVELSEGCEKCSCIVLAYNEDYNEVGLVSDGEVFNCGAVRLLREIDNQVLDWKPETSIKIIQSPEKEGVQPVLDEMVDSFINKQNGLISTYYGVPMDQFSKQELIAIIHQQNQAIESERQSHQSTLNLFTGKRK